MFLYGNFIYFRFKEWDLFGGLAMWIAFVCFLNLWALSNNSFSFTRVVGFFWKFTILLSAIRALAMILELNNNLVKIQYECDHGGYLYGATPDQYVAGKIPRFNVSVCSYGVGCFHTWTIICVIIDFICQIYMTFLNSRFKSQLEEYQAMIGPTKQGFYEA